MLDSDGLDADCGLIPAFLDVLPAVRESVSNVTDGFWGKVDDFRRCRNHIEKCLAHGIVPLGPPGIRQPKRPRSDRHNQRGVLLLHKRPGEADGQP
jgi:hypothetical protein